MHPLLFRPGDTDRVGIAGADSRGRLGFEYGFGIGRGFSIAPGVAVDFTEDENATVIGAVFTKKF